MKQLITIQILEEPQNGVQSFGGYREDCEVDDVEDEITVFTLVSGAYRKAVDVNTVIAPFCVVNIHGSTLYRGTISSDGEKTKISGIRIR